MRVQERPYSPWSRGRINRSANHAIRFASPTTSDFQIAAGLPARPASRPQAARRSKPPGSRPAVPRLVLRRLSYPWIFTCRSDHCQKDMYQRISLCQISCTAFCKIAWVEYEHRGSAQREQIAHREHFPGRWLHPARCARVHAPQDEAEVPHAEEHGDAMHSTKAEKALVAVDPGIDRLGPHS